MTDRKAIEVELKTWKISNPVPHPVVPRIYFTRYLAICESLAQANFGHLEMLDCCQDDRKKKGDVALESRGGTGGSATPEGQNSQKKGGGKKNGGGGGNSPPRK